MKTTGLNVANIQAREKLLESLLTLLNEKTMSSINIVELTRLAGVSRMTFYRNYSSIEQILMDRLNEILELYRYEDHYGTSGLKIMDKQYAIHFLQFMKEHHSFITCLINCGMGELILNAVTGYELEKWNCDSQDIELQCKIHMFAGGLYNLYVFWSACNFELDLNTMADVVSKFYIG